MDNNNKPWMKPIESPKETERILREMVQEPVQQPVWVQPPQSQQQYPRAPQGGGGQSQPSSPLPAASGYPPQYPKNQYQNPVPQQQHQVNQYPQYAPPASRGWDYQQQGPPPPPGWQPQQQMPLQGPQRPQQMRPPYPPSAQPPKKSEIPARKKKSALFWTMVGIVVISAIGLIISVVIYFQRYG